MHDIFTAGDTLDVAYTVAGYPASAGWSFKLRLIPQVVGVGAPIDIDTIPSGDDYRAQYGPLQTSTWQAGEYTLIRWVEKAGARYSAENLLELPTQVRILPDLATATVYDGRSPARQALDAAIAARNQSSGRGVIEYEIGGRRVVFEKKADLIAHIDSLKREVANEERAAQLANGINPRHLHIRFGRA